MAIRAAIYCRKSTAQDAAEDAKSVARQEESGRALCASRGWEAAAVYRDEGVSGFLFRGRPEFQAMMRDAAAGRFTELVIFDLDRFGRNSRRTVEALDALADLGVTVWDSSTGAAVDLDSFEGRLSAQLRAGAAQQYRDQVSKHTRAALRRKAEAGHVTGNRTYGYKNVRVGDHTERVVDPKEAKVVRDVFARFAAGEPIHRIVRRLNGKGVASPRGRGWSEPGIRKILARDLYRGEIIYGATRKAWGRDEVAQVPVASERWVRISAPGLRLVDEATWRRVATRLAERRAVRKGERAPERTHGGYLLTGGMLVCPLCGGHFEVRDKRFYVCATRRRKGTCSNALALEVKATDEGVLSSVENDRLSPEAVEELLRTVSPAGAGETEHLTAELTRVRAEVQRLVGSIAAGVPASSVAPAIREREAEAERLEARLRAPRPAAPDVKMLRSALEQRTREWRDVLRGKPELARLLLRRLVGPITLWDGALDAPAAAMVARAVRDGTSSRGSSMLDGLQAFR